jgi:hypothetical protein
MQWRTAIHCHLINLTDPKVTRPWIGLIVSNQRIDGRWAGDVWISVDKTKRGNAG